MKNSRPFSVGDKVKTIDYSLKLDRMTHTVMEVLTDQIACGSGTLVRIDGYENMLDSHWLRPISINERV